MEPDDINDLIFAAILLVIMGLVGGVFHFPQGSYTVQEVQLTDGEELLLLNYLKTETGSGNIANLIALSEKDEKNLILFRHATEQIMNFALEKNQDYIVKITYPGRDEEGAVYTIGFSPFTEELNDKNRIIKEMDIPSLDKGLIKVKLELENLEDTAFIKRL